MRGHRGCLGYIYIGSAADGVNIMLFYFITHTILGMLAANSTLIQKHAKNDVASYPLWVNMGSSGSCNYRL